MDVVIYSTPKCKYCAEAKRFFEDIGVEYQEINVAEDSEKRAEMVEISGQMGVPVITINGAVFVGFDEQDLQDEIDSLRYELEPLSEEDEQIN